jgi:hypothetical protein
MLGLVLAVELYVTRQNRDLCNTWAAAWSWSRQAADREAKRSEILCFGDSLVLHGVVPNVIERRLNRRAYNLAVFKGQGPSDYFLLRRALAAGARPAAVLVDGELLVEDPLELSRLWPELATFRDLGELAWAARSPYFFTDMAVAKLLPTYKARWEIRTCVVSALDGQAQPFRTEIRPRLRNAGLNRGAQVLPVAQQPTGPDPRLEDLKRYRPSSWEGHPINLRFVDQFLALAASRGIPVYWLLPPYHPMVQLRREQCGWDPGYMAYLAGLQARFPNLVVIDGRHAGYEPAVLHDLTHLNRIGAVAFSEAVAGVLAERPGDGRGPGPRWVKIPEYRESTDARAVEDVLASVEAIKQRYSSGPRVRR